MALKTLGPWVSFQSLYMCVWSNNGPVGHNSSDQYDLQNQDVFRYWQEIKYYFEKEKSPDFP